MQPEGPPPAKTSGTARSRSPYDRWHRTTGGTGGSVTPYAVPSEQHGRPKRMRGETDRGPGLGVGAVARRLGLAAATLRT